MPGQDPPQGQTLQWHRLCSSALAPIRPAPRPAALIRSWQAPGCLIPTRKHPPEDAGFRTGDGGCQAPQKAPCRDGGHLSMDQKKKKNPTPPAHHTTRHGRLLPKSLPRCQIFVKAATAFKGKSQKTGARPRRGRCPSLFSSWGVGVGGWDGWFNTPTWHMHGQRATATSFLGCCQRKKQGWLLKGGFASRGVWDKASRKL